MASTSIPGTFPVNLGPVKTLTDGSTIAWNMLTQQIVQVTLLGNGHTIANPSLIQDGNFYAMFIVQGAGAPFTVTWGSAFQFPGGITPTLSTTAGAVDLFQFIANSGLLYATTSSYATGQSPAVIIQGNPSLQYATPQSPFAVYNIVQASINGIGGTASPYSITYNGAAQAIGSVMIVFGPEYPAAAAYTIPTTLQGAYTVQTSSPNVANCTSSTSGSYIGGGYVCLGGPYWSETVCNNITFATHSPVGATNSSNVVTFPSSGFTVADLVVGQTIFMGAFFSNFGSISIPANTTIQTISGSTSMTLSNNVTVSGGFSITSWSGSSGGPYTIGFTHAALYATTSINVTGATPSSLNGIYYVNSSSTNTANISPQNGQTGTGGAGGTVSPTAYFNGNLLNNQWSCYITNYPSTYPNGTVLNWTFPNYPNDGGVYAYPNILWNMQPIYEYPVNHVLPILIGSLNSFTISMSYTYTGTPSTQFDILAEGYTTSTVYGFYIADNQNEISLQPTVGSAGSYIFGRTNYYNFTDSFSNNYFIAHKAPLGTITASCSGTNITISVGGGALTANQDYCISGAGVPSNAIFNPGGSPSNTTYALNQNVGTIGSETMFLAYVNTASFTGAISNGSGGSGNILTVTGWSGNSISVNSFLAGAGVSTGVTITAQLTGTAGSNGTYTVSSNFNIGAEAMTAKCIGAPLQIFIVPVNSPSGHTLANALDWGDGTVHQADLKGILQSLVSNGYINPNQYIGGWDLGAEPYAGTASMTIKSLTYTFS